MSEDSTPEERTELPSDRRMGELRKHGQIHCSSEVVTVVSLMSGFLALNAMWSLLLRDMNFVLERSFRLIARREPLSVTDLYNGMISILYIVGPDVMTITLIVAICASLSLLLQTKWNIKSKKIEFKWNLLQPMAGLKRIFSIGGVVNTLKSCVKLALILPIGYAVLSGFAPQMIQLVHLSIRDVMALTGIAMWEVFWKIFYVLLALAIFDYFWTRYQWFRVNKMTKDEVKDERKAVEGDEGTKRKIQAKGLARIAQRIRDSVPQADVVITNPTHYAVALKYDRETMDAPIVVAKGRGYMALRIREIAREAGVPVLERKSLARALFAAVEVGAAIPYELFKAVAEVLAYVYRLKNPRSLWGAAAS